MKLRFPEDRGTERLKLHMLLAEVALVILMGVAFWMLLQI